MGKELQESSTDEGGYSSEMPSTSTSCAMPLTLPAVIFHGKKNQLKNLRLNLKTALRIYILIQEELVLF